MTPDERKADVDRRFWSHMRAAAEAIERGDREAVILEWNVIVGMLDNEVQGRHRELGRRMVRALQEKKTALELVAKAKQAPPAKKGKRK